MPKKKRRFAAAADFPERNGIFAAKGHRPMVLGRAVSDLETYLAARLAL
jgi:hypothetical protein